MRGLFLTLFACLALPALSQEPVQKPEVKPGDRWVYRKINLWNNQQIRQPNFTVAFANKDIINVVVKRGEEEIDASFTAEWNVVNDPNFGVYVPSSGLLKFPLQAGASYPARFEIIRPKREDFRVKMDLAMKVVGWQEIEVPAGKFRALKVEGKGSYQRQDVTGSGQIFYSIWYAPEVKRWVKFTVENTNFRGQLNLRETDELVEFTLQ